MATKGMAMCGGREVVDGESAGAGEVWRRLMAAAVASAALVAAVVAGVVVAAPAARGQAEPLEEMVFVVNAFKFPDALAAASVGGSVGGPIVLTGRDELAPAAEQGLVAADGDVAVVVGGTAVVADEVLDEVAALGYEVRRIAGATRTETAAELVGFVGEQAYGRPVVTGREVVADTIPGLDAETLQGHSPGELGGGDGGDAGERLDDLEARLDDVEAANVELQARVAELEGILAGVSRGDVDGHDTLQFEAMNVQVVNGTDSTGGQPNGVGNLIVGYHEDLTCDPADDGCADVSDNGPDERTGSHMLVTGIDHTYTGFGGLLAGADNTTSGDWASVDGGFRNIASGRFAAVSGGAGSTASGPNASVSGGLSNIASGFAASVSGGADNTVSGAEASVSGGNGNEAAGSWSSVSGGRSNTAEGTAASVAGGDLNTASGEQASVSGGRSNTASGDFASVSGGSRNTASGVRAWVSGGDSNIASGRRASVSGGEGNTAEGLGASVSGGLGNTASGQQASVSAGSSNTASGFLASVSGGSGNTAADRRTTVAGGRDGEIPDDGSLDPGGNDYNSLIGNQLFDDG